jgi:hypothetical protein
MLILVSLTRKNSPSAKQKRLFLTFAFLQASSLVRESVLSRIFSFSAVVSYYYAKENGAWCVIDFAGTRIS